MMTMPRGVRGKLFLASMGVILVVGLPTAVWVRAELASTIEARVRDELGDQARAARIALISLPELDGPAAQQMVERLARDTGTEIDVIGFDRRKLASSSEGGVAGDILDRPEIHAAIGEGVGFARRAGRAFSAVRMVGRDQAGAVVRVSRPVDELDAAYQRFYLTLGVLAAIAVAVAIAMTWLASSVLTREVRRLADGAHALAGGGSRRIAVDTGDEIGALGGSINQLADGIERSIAALARERGLLESVVDGIDQGIVALDDERRVRLMNDAARKILDLSEAPVGDALIDHIRIPAILDLLPPAEPGRAEYQTPAGARVVVEVIPSSSGEGCLVMLQDVTAVRRLETIRRDFVANVSHELRTPVSIIRANAETLLGGAKDDPVFSAKLIDGLHRNAERLARILADLLDLSRLEAGQYRFELAPVDVRDAIDQAVASLDHAVSTKGVSVAVAAAPGSSVRADAKALDQVLVNLIDNAIKYTPSGSHVWIDVHPRGERVRIEVRDDGPGIAPRNRERVFERFYRVDPGRSRELGGTGLGLSIVKHLIESMGGQVGVEPNQPRGTTFWVELAAAAPP
jgi:two-component system phosphate regulon sensor histidine kinase PhoR